MSGLIVSQSFLSCSLIIYTAKNNEVICVGIYVDAMMLQH